jgi:hypothetical protein
MAAEQQVGKILVELWRDSAPLPIAATSLKSPTIRHKRIANSERRIKDQRRTPWWLVAV